MIYKLLLAILAYGILSAPLCHAEFKQSDFYPSKPPLKKNHKFETHTTTTTVVDGITFHVAEYHDANWGNTHVVTALDGEFKGYQIIAEDGAVKAASTDVQWRKDYFVHTYAELGMKIYTYPNKQVVEIKQ